MVAWSHKTWKKYPVFAFLQKNDPLRGSLQNSVLKEFITLLINVLCANLIKFGRWEIGKMVRYLPRKKISLRSPFCMDCAQNLPGPAGDSVLRVLQISSKSVHFRQSYIRTRQCRPSVLQSECNIWVKPSFEPNKKYTPTINGYPIWLPGYDRISAICQNSDQVRVHIWRQWTAADL